MSLNPGTWLASYEVLAPIGAGGMGEVYHARDAKLGREVAIKILPEAFTRPSCSSKKTTMRVVSSPTMTYHRMADF